MTWWMVPAFVVGPLVVGLGLVAIVGATLGRRARAGRLSGRYTSTPGNSGDASSSGGGFGGG